MFRPGDVGHISTPTHILETQHFPQYMSCSKQRCHLRTHDDVRYTQGVLRGRQILGDSPQCIHHKRDNLRYCLVYFSYLLCQVQIYET